MENGKWERARERKLQFLPHFKAKHSKHVRKGKNLKVKLLKAPMKYKKKIATKDCKKATAMLELPLPCTE